MGKPCPFLSLFGDMVLNSLFICNLKPLFINLGHRKGFLLFLEYLCMGGRNCIHPRKKHKS